MSRLALIALVFTLSNATAQPCASPDFDSTGIKNAVPPLFDALDKTEAAVKADCLSAQTAEDFKEYAGWLKDGIEERLEKINTGTDVCDTIKDMKDLVESLMSELLRIDCIPDDMKEPLETAAAALVEELKKSL